MNKIIPAIIAGLFILIGGAGGFYLKNSGSANAATAEWRLAQASPMRVKRKN